MITIKCDLVLTIGQAGVGFLDELKLIHEQARERLKGICRVCPVCDGLSCISGVPGMGGRNHNRQGVRRNRAALEQILLNLRTIHEINAADTRYELFGVKLESPIMVAPMCETAYNFLNRIDDYDFILSQVEGAENAGTIAFTGDSPDPPLFELGLKASRKKTAGKGIPIIKPREKKEIIKRVRLAEDNGSLAVGIDIDAAGFENFSTPGQPFGSLSFSTIRDIIEDTSLPFILKGIMTAEEAVEAVNCGAAGLVVSNHGGRALDSTPGSAEVLPEIVAAVKGSIKIFVDGGIRSGEDILKLLALGAEAVLIGRPVAIAAVGGGADGVSMQLRLLEDDLRRSMLLTGCSSLELVGPFLIRKALF